MGGGVWACGRPFDEAMSDGYNACEYAARLRRERDDARESQYEWEQAARRNGDTSRRIYRELHEARAENESLRRVVEAAEAWVDVTDPDPGGNKYVATIAAIRAAVDEYRNELIRLERNLSNETS